MIDVKAILYDVCGDEAVFTPGLDLVESGILDSLAVIDLFYALEAEGISLQPTQIDRRLLHSVEGIEKLVREAESKLPNR